MSTPPAGLASQLFQVAYVVSDLAAAESWFRTALGVPCFERMEGVVLGEGCRHRGEPADAVLDLSLGFMGETQIELVRPGRGESIHAEFLRGGHTGLHHTGYLVADFDAAVAGLRSAGVECVADGVLVGEMRVDFAYFDATGPGGSYLEILHFDAAAHRFMNDLKGRSPAGAGPSRRE